MADAAPSRTMVHGSTAGGPFTPPAHPRRAGNPWLVMAALTALAASAALVSANIGAAGVGPGDVLRSLAGMGTVDSDLVLFHFRLPRIVLGLLVGAGLAMAGGVLQGVARNGLADAGIMGVNAGAGLGVTAYFALVWEGVDARIQTVSHLLTLAAFLGAALAAVLTFKLAKTRGGVSPSRLILVGIAVGFGLGAAQLLLAVSMERSAYQATVIRLMGSIANKPWESVYVLLPWLAALVPFVLYKARVLNVLNLGDGVAAGVGVAIERERTLLIGAAVAIAAACVAVGGGIGFIGLLGPQVARRLVGPRHQVMLPVAALVGMTLVTVADTFARNLMDREIPVGIIVAIVGAPYFLYLLVRSKG